MTKTLAWTNHAGLFFMRGNERRILQTVTALTLSKIEIPAGLKLAEYRAH